MFSLKERQQSIDNAGKRRVEVLIVGGGVVGCSIAAYASKLGLNCLLVERDDLASGASGNSTGLAHAGLRYLAQGRIRYVFRESRERRRLEQMAPHWVRPFNFLLPVYEGDPFSLWKVRLGTWIYDGLAAADAIAAGAKLPRRHKTLRPEEVIQRVSRLREEGLTGGVEYYVDSQLLDSRFTLGMAQRAFAQGAGILTHTEVTSIETESLSLRAVRCRNQLTGEEFLVSPQLVINATGAWIDAARKLINMRQPLLLRSQGIHLIVDRLSDKPLIFSTAVPGRVFFVLPIGRDASLVGTTDTPVSVPPDEAMPQAGEVQELVANLFHFFRHLDGHKTPQSYIRQCVRDVYWAQRPLLHQEGSTVKASREHRLVKELPYFWSVPGVKLTAGRAVGEEVAREAFTSLRGRAAPVIDLGRLPGGEIDNFEQFVADLRARHPNAPPGTVDYLATTYGTRAEEVFGLAEKDARLAEVVVPNEPWIYAEAAYAAQEEMVMSLNDFLWRRTKWSHLSSLNDEVVYRLAMILAARLGWVNQEINDQIASFRQQEQKHRVRVTG